MPWHQFQRTELSWNRRPFPKRNDDRRGLGFLVGILNGKIGADDPGGVAAAFGVMRLQVGYSGILE